MSLKNILIKSSFSVLWLSLILILGGSIFFNFKARAQEYVEPIPVVDNTELILDQNYIISDKLDTLNYYLSLPELSSSTDETIFPRYETQYQRDEYIIAYLIRLENQIQGLYAICGK